MVNYATAPMHNHLKRDMMHVRKQINHLNLQVATQQKYQTFSEAPVDKLRLIRELGNNIKTLHNSKNNNEILAKKLNIYENSLMELSGILGNGFQFVQEIATGSNSMNLNIFSVTQVSNQYLNQIQGVLNRSFNGQYLFSGSMINTTPVANVALNPSVIQQNYGSNTNYIITSNYYLGDDLTPTTQISDTINLNYGLTADNQVFQNFFAAFQYTQFFANSQGKEQQQIQQALSLLQQVQQGLGSMIATMGSNSLILENVIKQQTDQLAEYETLVGSLTTIDPSITLQELPEKMEQLQAIYMATSKMQDMFIGNYVK